MALLGKIITAENLKRDVINWYDMFKWGGQSIVFYYIVRLPVQCGVTFLVGLVWLGYAQKSCRSIIFLEG